MPALTGTVSEWIRLMSDRNVKMVIDRFWPETARRFNAFHALENGSGLTCIA